jgi:predicted small secreted protein
MKGMIFAGCSFTWGQGLYYYSNLNHIPTMEEWSFDYKLMTDALINFKNTLRYPRLVANHFNTFEVCKDTNGGSDELSIKLIEKLFCEYNNCDNKTLMGSYDYLTKQNYHYDDIEYVIYQTTQLARSKYIFNHKNKEYHLYANYSQTGLSRLVSVNENNMYDEITESYDIFYEWCVDNNLTVEEWLQEHKRHWFNNIKNTLLNLESKGIKTKLLCWTNDYMDLVFNDDFMKERLVKLNYNDQTYNSISDIMLKNKSLEISNDNDYFNGNPPVGDYHPSKLCHQIIADNIIKSIENN